MGLLSSSKKSTTINETRNTSSNQAAEDQAIILNDVSGTSITLSDHDSIEGALGLAARVADDAEQLGQYALSQADRTSDRAFEATSEALQSGFDSFAQANRTQSESIFSELSRTVIILAGLGVAAYVIPKVWK